MKIENTAQGQKAIALKLKVVYDINGMTVRIFSTLLFNFFIANSRKGRQ